MNPDEKELASHIIKMSKNSAKFTKYYLDLMRAVKLRLECEKMVSAELKK